MENFEFNYKNNTGGANNKDYYRDEFKENNVDDLKDKLSVVGNKLANVKKEKEQLQKENKELQNDILILQSNIRQMIPGFSSNTSGSFPMLNELQNKISEFMKCDCLDIFFDLLSVELNMEGIVFFYKNAFTRVHEMIISYFDPLDVILKKTLCIDSLWSPIDNVLRKSFQANWKKIHNQVVSEQSVGCIMTFIQSSLKLQDEEPSANKQILEFLKKCAEIMFFCHISDPPVHVDYRVLGQKVFFMGGKFDSIDGFIKQKHECALILPPVYKGNTTGSENLLVKPQVLPLDYEFP
jgi:hypothetical protein